MGTRVMYMSEDLLLHLLKGKAWRMDQVTVDPPFPEDVQITGVHRRFLRGVKTLQIHLFSKQYEGENIVLEPQYTRHFDYETVPPVDLKKDTEGDVTNIPKIT